MAYILTDEQYGLIIKLIERAGRVLAELEDFGELSEREQRLDETVDEAYEEFVMGQNNMIVGE